LPSTCTRAWARTAMSSTWPHDGIEGRRLATGGDYDLVLLDVMLPGVDGFGVLQGDAPARPQATAGADAHRARQGRGPGARPGGGADDYLVKPFAFSANCWPASARCCAAGRGRRPQRRTDAAPGRPRARPARPPGHARQRAAGPDGQGVQAADAAAAPARADPVAHHAGRAGVGHELRLRHQCRRGRGAPAARQARRPLPHKLLHTVRGMGYVLEDRT
jgi:two-component system copper resistance phosphate regulon response regulator CusR